MPQYHGLNICLHLFTDYGDLLAKTQLQLCDSFQRTYRFGEIHELKPNIRFCLNGYV